jgi:heterodisulfide reductase subunit A
MYALKEAMVTKERYQDDIETVVFYMDMRTSGKDYELYLNRAKQEFGVRFERTRPHTVEPVSGSDGLCVTYIPEGEGLPRSEIFDMVVLSTGFLVPPDLVELSKRLGIELNEHHFVKTGAFNPVTTSKPGIYVCGLLEGPKDIPETMVQASAAACMALPCVNVSGEPQEEEEQDIFPPERDVSLEEPRVGVFICDCGYNIGGLIDVRELARYAKRLPRVSVSEMIGHGCSLHSLERIQGLIRDCNLNRVVMGACSPRTHETLFQDTLRKAGLNKYLVEMANLRDQDTWVHSDHPEEALNKAKDLIRMAVASVAIARPLTDHTLPMNKNILVVGGGVAGMNAALTLADQGLRVYLVERSAQLGGVSRELRRTLEGEDVRLYLSDLIQQTMQHKNIQVLKRAVIVDHSGMPGLFTTGVQAGPQMFYRQIVHGVTVLATGAVPNRPEEYFLDQHEAVMTQLDLDKVIEDAPEKAKSWQKVVMIQCVGSRCPENPNCARICCQSAVKNALRLLDLNPRIQVYVLYRDMRTYGFQEDFYRKAREKVCSSFSMTRGKSPLFMPTAARWTWPFETPSWQES